MRLSKKIEVELADKFEDMLEYIPALDKLPYHRKREAAEVAAKVAFEYLVAHQ
jgi:hypothetical protein